MEKDFDSKTKLEAGAISEEVFNRELGMCKKLNKRNGGKCCWGECNRCGVVPLLFKLHKGELLEKPEEIASKKKALFL